MNPSAEVLRVSLSNPKIYFKDKSTPPVKYSLKNLMDFPVHLAKRAIELAEINYMNEHFLAKVLYEVGDATSVICVGVFEGRATWEAKSSLYGYEWYVTTDIEGNILTDQDQS
ncbi:MAG: hypothetical protein LCH90_24295 [Proteobacteria bacterium]|nr:hypothetical protein [Pseudomonadota bacterium]